MEEILGNRPVCVAREMTKIYEEYARGNIAEIIEFFGERRVRGEFTVVVGGAGVSSSFFD